MRNLLRSIARRLGLETWYHVAATYSIPGGSATISMTCGLRPWLHADNYADLVTYVASQADQSIAAPTIVSITRLGA